MIRDGIRVTVFWREYKWAYASAPIGKQTVHYSENYETESEAKRAALYDLFGIGAEIQSLQDIRETERAKTVNSNKFRSSILEDLIKQNAELKKLSTTLQHTITNHSGPPQVKTLKQNLRRQLNSSKNILFRTIEADMDEQEKEAMQVVESYLDLFDLVEKFESSKPN